MAVVYESISANVEHTNAGNVSIDIAKPTGLAEGDLMIACIFTDGGSTTTGTPTATGWTVISTSSTLEQTKTYVFYKEATASDAAASTFTFSATYGGTGDATIMGRIVRVSGSALGITPQADETFDNNRNSTSVSMGAYSLTPTYNNSLLLVMITGTNNEVGGITFSSLNLGKSLTWTSRGGGTKNNEDDGSYEIFTATFATASEITSMTATASAAQDDYMAHVVAISPRVDVSVALGTISVTATQQTLSPAGDANVTLGQVGITATQNAISPATADPDWSNKDKSANTSFTNKNKS